MLRKSTKSALIILFFFFKFLVTISCITSLLVVILKGHLAPALAGLALTYAAHISGVFQFTVRLMSDTEARFISVERIVNHIEVGIKKKKKKKKIFV